MGVGEGVLLLKKFVFSEFLSNIINEGIDRTKEEIKKVIYDKNDETLSTRIYGVIENTLNTMTGNQYKNQDNIYEAVEKIFIEFKNGRDSIDAVKSGLGLLVSDIQYSRCETFIERFYDGICQDEYLYRRVTIMFQEKGIWLNQSGLQQLNETIENDYARISKKVEALEQVLHAGNLIFKGSVKEMDEKFCKNKKSDYIKSWNSRLFLHVNNDERPITLAEAFIIPDYHVSNQKKGTGISIHDTFDKIIEKFVNYGRTSTMLIGGAPGIGKSTVVSWIANKYKNNDNVIILRFRDWKGVMLEKTLLNAICNRLNCEEEDLEEKVLILDGFDEMKVLHIRDQLLDDFFKEIKDFENFKCIITSRPTYIESTQFSHVVMLQEFTIEKIKDFYFIITGKTLNVTKEIETNIDVLGIPVILYMAIMSDIDFTQKTTKTELYNRIFAERGGIPSPSIRFPG